MKKFNIELPVTLTTICYDDSWLLVVNEDISEATAIPIDLLGRAKQRCITTPKKGLIFRLTLFTATVNFGKYEKKYPLKEKKQGSVGSGILLGFQLDCLCVRVGMRIESRSTRQYFGAESNNLDHFSQ